MHTVIGLSFRPSICVYVCRPTSLENRMGNNPFGICDFTVTGLVPFKHLQETNIETPPLACPYFRFVNCFRNGKIRLYIVRFNILYQKWNLEQCLEEILKLNYEKIRQEKNPARRFEAQ